MLEAVHFNLDLIQGLLALVVSATHTATAAATDGVNFVNEDNAWRVFLALAKRSRTREAPTPTNHFYEF